MSVLSKPYFHDEAAAFALVESVIWPAGPTCPHCGAVDRIAKLDGVKDKKGRVRPGLWKCYHCRKQLTVRIGTIFEDSHLPLRIWLQAIHLMVTSKKGVSSNQLHRMLSITLKSAWFLSHRIREAMKDDGSPLGGPGVTVEADETFHGKADFVFVTGKGWQQKKGTGTKQHKIVSLVERGGRARSVKVEDLDLSTLRGVLSQVDPVSRLHTDAAAHYKSLGKGFAKHESVNHSAKEYARGDVTTNTVEGFFSIFKRGMVGVYQHCGEQHLQRYLTEFDFRYSNRVALGVNDEDRAERALKGIVGRRLTYRGKSNQRGEIIPFPARP
jgi:transposase-like protein